MPETRDIMMIGKSESPSSPSGPLVALFAVICLAAGPATPYNADLASSTNKFLLSDAAYDSLRLQILRGDQLPWFSIPHLLDPEHGNRALRLSAGDQQASVGIHGILIGDGRKSHDALNYFLGGVVAYRSRHIRGEFQCDLHSLDTLPTTTFADSLNDISPELILSGKSIHVSGTALKSIGMPVAYVQAEFDHLKLLTGRYRLRWGPGYKSTLALSGNGRTPSYYYLLELAFGTHVYAASFLSALDDDRRFVSDTVPNHERFSAGQRLDVRIGKHLQVGLYELVNFNGADLLSRYAIPVQFYYVTNHLGGMDEYRSNILGGCDVNVTVGRVRVYGEFLNDDITFLTEDKSPNKFAFQVGNAVYGDELFREAGIEFTHISHGTYGHGMPGLNRHTYWDQPRGWPWGNDQDLWHARLLLGLPYRFLLRSELNWWIKGKGAVTDYHWDVPDSLRPDLKNKGGMVDYHAGRHLFAPGLELTFQPRSWMEFAAGYHPQFGAFAPVHRIRATGRCDIPGRWGWVLDARGKDYGDGPSYR